MAITIPLKRMVYKKKLQKLRIALVEKKVATTITFFYIATIILYFKEKRGLTENFNNLNIPLE